MNWIKEGQADYLEKSAADFLHLTDQGRNLQNQSFEGIVADFPPAYDTRLTPTP